MSSEDENTIGAKFILRGSFINICATKQTNQKTRPIPREKSPFFNRDKSQTSVLICVYLRLKLLYSGAGLFHLFAFLKDDW